MSELRSGPPPHGLDHLIGISDLADVIGVPVATIYDWRSRGLGPVGHRFGKHVKFAAADVEAWIASHREQPSAGTVRHPEGPERGQGGPTVSAGRCHPAPPGPRTTDNRRAPDCGPGQPAANASQAGGPK
ncbi:MAG: helix-turn-helix domain-containing protein [Bifidobacteriaceae bacterium]|jgi:predicted DNA-binding transcriptional regulator AlpA|nr:helix-turn-helix domain-containing protein [Bifidobacteriaceae bacterium]